MPSATIDPRAVAVRLTRQIDSDIVELLAIEPVETIEAFFDIPILFRPGGAKPGGCGVHGAYDPGPPARIFIADDILPTRRAFTALHELGHHLIEHDDELNDIGLTHDDQRIEEVADAIAAALILNDKLVAAHLTVQPPTARQVADLFQATMASRSACCVAAAQRLGRHGCVILGKPDGTAHFIAHQIATPWRVARGTPQGGESIIARSAARQGAAISARTSVTFAGGNRSSELWATAFGAQDGWVYAVFVSDTIDPWAPKAGLHLPPARGEFGEEYECARCDVAFTSGGAPCKKCGSPKHDVCGRCVCQPKTRVCAGPCGLLVPEHLFPNGGTICVDCE